MVNQRDIEDRGRALGLTPRPTRIEVSRGGPKRRWRRIPASQIRLGDVVPSHGVVDTVVRGEGQVGLYCGDDSVVYFRLDEIVHCFTASNG